MLRGRRRAMTDIQQQAPDATADRETLLAWYRDVVQTYVATHCYDDFIVRCYWCSADDQQVKARDAGRYAGNKYCTDRCADAAEAYRTKVLCVDKTPQPIVAEADAETAPVAGAAPPSEDEW
jgi:hypothetical protein